MDKVLFDKWMTKENPIFYARKLGFIVIYSNLKSKSSKSK